MEQKFPLLPFYFFVAGCWFNHKLKHGGKFVCEFGGVGIRSELHQLETMLSVSVTKPSPVQSLSDCRPSLMAFRCWIASFCRCTKSVCVVKYGRDALGR